MLGKGGGAEKIGKGGEYNVEMDAWCDIEG